MLRLTYGWIWILSYALLRFFGTIHLVGAIRIGPGKRLNPFFPKLGHGLTFDKLSAERTFPRRAKLLWQVARTY